MYACFLLQKSSFCSGLLSANNKLYFLNLVTIFKINVQGMTIIIDRLSALAIDADDIILPDDQGVGAVEVFVDQYNAWLPVCYTTSWDNSAESKSSIGNRDLIQHVIQVS